MSSVKVKVQVYAHHDYSAARDETWIAIYVDGKKVNDSSWFGWHAVVAEVEDHRHKRGTGLRAKQARKRGPGSRPRKQP